MAIINCAECGNTFSDKAPACPHCGCPIEFARTQTATKEEPVQIITKRNDAKTTLLRDYLERIRLLETDVYTLSALADKLRPMIKSYPSKNVIKPPTKPVLPSSPLLKKEESVGKKAAKAFGKELEEFFAAPVSSVVLGVGKSAKEAMKTAKENKARKKANIEEQERYERDVQRYYERRLPEYEKQMVIYEEKVKEEAARHELAVARIQLYNQGITEQIEHVEQEKENTINALKKLYDTGIIFPKYRGIIPVTMFCEYMDSGRRTELEGVHGMYDLYEQELLGKLIVDGIGQVNDNLRFIRYQIDGIASQLSGIARNQIMLHEEIAHGNEMSRKISQDTSELLSQSSAMLHSAEKIEGKLGSISKNSEMAAYNTELTARRVDAIAKIEEYEYALRHPMFPGV